MSQNKRTKTQKPHTIDEAHSHRGYHADSTSPANSKIIQPHEKGSSKPQNPHANHSPRTTLSQPRHK